MNKFSAELSDAESLWAVTRIDFLSCPEAQLSIGQKMTVKTSSLLTYLAFERIVRGLAVIYECYLVDPASSHMLVSKIKPCMCKYERIQTVKLRMAH